MIGEFFRTLLANPKSRTGLGLLAFFILVAIFAPLLAPYAPKQDRVVSTKLVETRPVDSSSVDLQEISEDEQIETFEETEVRVVQKHTRYFPLRSRPVKGHILGTNHAGNDLFSQLVLGTRMSLSVGLATGLFVTLVSLTLALLAGYLGGAVDDVISFFTNVFLVLPGLPLMIVIAAYVTMKGVLPIVLILGLTGWPWPTRLLRAQVMSLRSRDFVRVSRSLGESPLHIVFREILPNMISIAMAEFFAISMTAIMGEATLEFIGLGNVTVVSWGTILFWAQANGALLAGAWWWFLPPGLCIAALGTSFVLINFGIDEISNPKLRKR